MVMSTCYLENPYLVWIDTLMVGKLFIIISVDIGLKIFYGTLWIYGSQEMKFSIKDFPNKCDQIDWRIWLYLLKKPLVENFIFYASTA